MAHYLWDPEKVLTKRMQNGSGHLGSVRLENGCIHSRHENDANLENLYHLDLPARPIFLQPVLHETICLFCFFDCDLD